MEPIVLTWVRYEGGGSRVLSPGLPARPRRQKNDHAAKNRITEQAPARRAGMPLPAPPVRRDNQLRNPSELAPTQRSSVDVCGTAASPKATRSAKKLKTCRREPTRRRPLNQLER